MLQKRTYHFIYVQMKSGFSVLGARFLGVLLYSHNILINTFTVDILCITETWLNSDVTDAEVVLKKTISSEVNDRVAD